MGMYITYICGDDIYICFRTRVRAALATKCDTRAAIMSVSCTVFGLQVREIPNSGALSMAQMNFQYDAVDRACAKKILSNPIPLYAATNWSFRTQTRLPKYPQVVQTFEPSPFIAHRIYRPRYTFVLLQFTEVWYSDEEEDPCKTRFALSGETFLLIIY